jgi:hypothetical protein
MVGTRHILGLAIDDAGVVATELSIQAGRPEVRRTGELLWDQQLTAETAKPLGERLRHFLREHGFSARRAVVGLAAKWVLTKEVDAPPASPEALSGLLSIQAERAFSLNAEELIFDYCGQTSTSEKNQVLLLAARRKIVEEIKELMLAAGLQVQSITLSALACSKALSEGGLAFRYGLYARPTYCEFWAQMEGSPRFLKHVPLGKNGTPDAYAELLASTVERLVLLSPVPGQTPPYRVTTYDACGLPDGLIDGLGKRLEPQITVSNGRTGLQSKGLHLQDRPDAARAIAAAAVAMTGVGPEKPPVDFLNPRVGAKQAVSHKRLLVWGAGIAGACVLGVLLLLAFWYGYKRDIAANEQWLKDKDAEIAAAQEIVDKIKYAKPWIDSQPQFLECLKELTVAFPEDPSIWAKNLMLSETGTGPGVGKTVSESGVYTGSVVGKAVSESAFNSVLGKIKQNQKVFPEAKMMYLRRAGRDSREYDFAINFKFQFRGGK